MSHLDGLRAHPDHVVSLGAEAIWLSPVFPSPMADFGYDVSDYCDIDPVFGTAWCQGGAVGTPRARARPRPGHSAAWLGTPICVSALPPRSGTSPCDLSELFLAPGEGMLLRL